MPSLRPVTAPLPATPGKGRPWWRWWWVIAGIIIVVAGMGGFMKVRHEGRERDDVVRKALASLPAALAEVPVAMMQGREDPSVRLRKACAVLAAQFKMPAAQLQSEMTRLAYNIVKEDADPAAAMADRARTGAQLMTLYLLPNPADPLTLKRREKYAMTLGLGPEAYFAGSNDRGAVLNKEGEAELRAVLAMRCAVQGVSHADTLNTWLLVATNLYRQERDEEAEVECSKLLTYYNRAPKLYVERAPRELMADIYRERGKFVEEEPFRRWLLAESARDRGADSVSAAKDHFDLALCLKELGNKEEAMQQALEARNRFKKWQRAAETSGAETLLNELTKELTP